MLIVDLPDTKGPDGNIVGWDLHYGRTDLIQLTESLKPEDVPIRPGETHVFTIADRFVRGWERIAREGKVHRPKKVRVLFQFINFGDGTGLDTTTAVPISRPKEASNSTGGCGTDGKKTNQKDSTENWPLVAWSASGDSQWVKFFI